MVKVKGTQRGGSADAAPSPAEQAPAPPKAAPRPRRASPGEGPAEAKPAKVFPIMGIGASAGGVEALEHFMAQVPAGSGLAMVVVQHLDPTHKDFMVELLQRKSRVPVVQVTDGMKVRPNHIYVLPPNCDLGIRSGVLHLQPPGERRGLRLPIDFFFKSLAEDQQHRSLGVILSGMGSDGTAGARAIKEAGGAVFVQNPSKFDGMPRSVMDAGLADVAAPVEALAGRILDYLQHIPAIATPASPAAEGVDTSNLDKIIALLRSRTGHDFTYYKKSTLYRRIERRMALHQLPRIADYVRFLRENPQESALLFRELLIGVTSFFRDPDVWEELVAKVLPALIAAHPEGATFRAWCAGCSTGEEAYSLAMAFREVLEKLQPTGWYTLQVFATDLDREAVDKARSGVYPLGSLQGISEERLAKWFVPDERGYRIRKDIREMVIFAAQNLVMDPPFTKLDLLVCRNLLIYLEGTLQQRLIPLFHYSLNPDGFLVLGISESIGQAHDLFQAISAKSRIFRRLPAVQRVEALSFTSTLSGLATSIQSHPAEGNPPMAARAGLNLQSLTTALMLQRYAPAAVLTTATGDIVYFSGRTGRYLEPPAGKANLNIFAMAREGLAGPLNEAFPRVVRQRQPLALRCHVAGPAGTPQEVDLRVEPLEEPADLQGMFLVVFQDAPALPPPAKGGKERPSAAQAARNATLVLELQQSRAELQTLHEDMQASQEELKSANEELQSTNEELQSTNEELTTSKEEMQSMNEELQTINTELQAKVNELSQSKDDMSNLLNSIDIATLFLDEGLKVRRFTPQITSIINLIPGDTGRPITDLVTALDYPTLAEDGREVLRMLIPHEQQAQSHDGRWFTVRIMPYRTQDNRIDGLVITFLDITTAKALEASLREALSVLQARLVDQASAPGALEDLEASLRRAEATLAARPASAIPLPASPQPPPAAPPQLAPGTPRKKP